MIAGPAILPEIHAALQPHGIFLRGVVPFDDDGPLLAEGGRAESVVLLGNIGGSIWEPFSRWRAKAENAGRRDPLDDWSRSVIAPLAARFGATAYFPSDPPWQPFQRWAMRAEGLKASPLGILIHPEYGLWHGYRGALGFSMRFPVDREIKRSSHPCDDCRGRPCLSACPAGAVTADGFLVGDCRGYIAGDEGRAVCMRHGCLARNACPVGTGYRYGSEQLRFHMEALGTFS